MSDAAQSVVLSSNRKMAVIVLGMHRSGTSAVTRGLEVLGVQLGDNLHPSGADNPKGFWEDKDCLALNERLLASVGSAYDRLGLVSWDLPSHDPAITGYAAEAEALIRKKLDTGTYWGFKDPRTARLLPFWLEVLERVGCDIGFIIALRNPLSVMQSLQKRNAFEPEKSFYLWLEHVVPAVIGTRGRKRIVVDYDTLLAAPETQLRRIAQGLDLPGPDAEALRVYESEFLETDLRHTQYTPEDLRQNPAVPIQVCIAYELLHRVAADELSIDDHEVEDAFLELEAELVSILPALSLIARQESKLWELGSALRDAQETVNANTGKLLEVNHALFENSRTVQTLRSLLGEFAEQNAASINQLTASLKESTKLLAAHSSTIQAGEQRLESLAQTVQVLADRVEAMRRSSARYAASRVYWAFRRTAMRLVRATWRALPLSDRSKDALKAYAFTRFGFVFRRTYAYRVWQDHLKFMEEAGKFARYPEQLPPFHARLPDYVPLTMAPPLRKKEARLICFYLPQFHPIPENDEWWGKGFTEWTNVAPAQPQYEGHYQPHIPGELGYYDLREHAVQQRQVELAKLYGIEGFCFYFYWFGGKRLLETPIENYLKDRSLDLPFCLCWANENWSRRWDGLDSEILIAQNHSPADDVAFIAYIAKYLRDPRYIRIDGKPLLLVYRPGVLPEPAETVRRWRKWCRENGIGEIYLAYTQSFESVDPRRYGFDAAIEFPPNNSSLLPARDQVAPLHPDFGSNIYEWRTLVKRSRQYPKPEYTLFRGVCPSWDNTARKKTRGTVLLNSSPRGYEEWLSNAISDTVTRIKSTDERLVFINAWNEWAEGAHLEPDAKYGYAFLDATRRALENNDPAQNLGSIVVVTHDAYHHGAQYLALNMTRALQQDFHLDVEVVCLGGGPLKAEFAKHGRLHDLEGQDQRGEAAVRVAADLAARGHRWAIVNSTVSGLFLETLTAHGIRCVALVHELSGILAQYKLEEHANVIAKHAEKVIFPARLVKESFRAIAPLREDAYVIRPQGLHKRNRYRGNLAQARQELRAELKLPKNARVVLGAGYADRRKGVDLFIEAGLEVLKATPDAYMVWLGHWEADMQATVAAMLETCSADIRKHFIFPGRKDDTDVFYAGADVMALTSREDPFPTVALDAMGGSLPIVCFGATGGIPELVRRAESGLVAPAFDVAAYAEALNRVLAEDALRETFAANAQAMVESEFSFRRYLFSVLEALAFPIRRVSVVVPNYNYAHYLKERVDSIVQQRYPIYELILLDDCSSDGSAELIRKIAAEIDVDTRVECSGSNSGCVFVQWDKGVRQATGDVVWIAEADDLSDPDFLLEVMRGFDYPNVVMSYCESRQIDSAGQAIGKNYLEYVADVDPYRWLTRYVADGTDEIAEALSIKNTIPNVSAVVFDRAAMVKALDAAGSLATQFRVAGDWRVYMEILSQGRIAYSTRSANLHRRHQDSVTNSGLNIAQLGEIVQMQTLVARRYNVRAEKREGAKRYAEQVYARLRVEGNGGPTLEQLIRAAEASA
ncbi:glycoside hydrolase family 99-like domain-containing protein [Bordetella bronchialis]|uniref:glycoside hydrolase family 99-like domain-containing protein n=1 Tax=Bordetella bronchialis TaxID=463025 RepID=UPI003D06DE46